jgi:hypothetical protein
MVMSSRSVWINDPVQVVAQIYDGCSWKGSTSRHSEGLQQFWGKSWGVSYRRASAKKLPIPGSFNWNEAMRMTHRDEVNAYRKMPRETLKAMARMMKDDYPEPLFCIVVAMCMTKLKSKEKP